MVWFTQGQGVCAQCQHSAAQRGARARGERRRRSPWPTTLRPRRPRITFIFITCRPKIRFIGKMRSGLVVVVVFSRQRSSLAQPLGLQDQQDRLSTALASQRRIGRRREQQQRRRFIDVGRRRSYVGTTWRCGASHKVLLLRDAAHLKVRWKVPNNFFSTGVRTTPPCFRPLADALVTSKKPAGRASARAV